MDSVEPYFKKIQELAACCELPPKSNDLVPARGKAQNLQLPHLLVILCVAEDLNVDISGQYESLEKCGIVMYSL